MVKNFTSNLGRCSNEYNRQKEIAEQINCWLFIYKVESGLSNINIGCRRPKTPRCSVENLLLIFHKERKLIEFIISLP